MNYKNCPLPALLMVLSITTASYADLLEQTHHTLTFAEVKTPETDAEKRSILTSDHVMIDGKRHDITYHTIMRSGDRIGEHVYGRLIDAYGHPITNKQGVPKISRNIDFSSLLPVGNKLFMVSHFETNPGAMYLTELAQHPQTGLLSPVSTQPLDLSNIHGGWSHCAGVVTPWRTHLGSEEYEPDAKLRNPFTGHIDYYQRIMADYYGGDLLALNPYDYGYPIQVKIHDDTGRYSVHKHYAMGRISLELAYVMPDQKTVYLSDDGTNSGLFLFIADGVRNLDAGTLYAMHWQQTGSENGGQAAISWISLGYATSQEIKTYIAQQPKVAFDLFHDIFDEIKPIDDKCPKPFTSINTTRGHECLRVRPGKEIIASRLETRRYAAMLGATTELRKEEGITYNPEQKTLYISMSKIEQGMEDYQDHGIPSESYDNGGPNHIKLPYNLCGGIYGLNVGYEPRMASEYVAKTMSGVIMGNMTQAYDKNSSIPAYDETGSFAHNYCDINRIANPDNITYIAGYNTLIIGEDSGDGHQNDIIWAYNVQTERLTRLQTLPYGSEATSQYIYKDIKGFSYLMSVIQHPFGESDVDYITPQDKQGYIGFIGPFPALK